MDIYIFGHPTIPSQWQGNEPMFDQLYNNGADRNIQAVATLYGLTYLDCRHALIEFRNQQTRLSLIGVANAALKSQDSAVGQFMIQRSLAY